MFCSFSGEYKPEVLHVYALRDTPSCYPTPQRANGKNDEIRVKKANIDLIGHRLSKHSHLDIL